MDELTSEHDGEQLSRALGQAMGELSPDLGRLVAGAATQGRSLRRRRRAQAAASVAAVVALAVGLPQLVVPGGQSSGQSGAQILTAASGGQASPRPSYAPTGPSGAQGPNGTWAITGQGVLLAARDALPQGTVFVRPQGSTSATTLPGQALPAVGAGGTGWLTEDHGQGAQTLSVGITADAVQVLAGEREAKGVSGKLEDTIACPSTLPSYLTSCTVSTLPDGGQMRIAEGFQSTSGTSRSVFLLRSDGTLVIATAQHTQPGSATGATAQPGLSMPELTVDQLKAVVQSAELQPWVTAQFSARAASAIQPYEDLNPGNGTPSSRPSGAPSSNAG